MGDFKITKKNLFSYTPFIFITLTFMCAMSHVHGIDPSLNDLFSLSSTTTWKEFKLTPTSKNFKSEKWVWTELITLKSKQALKLKELRIQWIGKKIKQLSASLYLKRKEGEVLIPIEENLVCDGFWDRKKQQIIFPMNEKIIATNSYYLVLSFQRNIESLLKKGKFVLYKQNLLALSHTTP